MKEYTILQKKRDYRSKNFDVIGKSYVGDFINDVYKTTGQLSFTMSKKLVLRIN